MKRIIGALVALFAVAIGMGSAPVSGQEPTREGSFYLDTVVVGGTATPGDFSYTVGGVGPIVDTSAGTCSAGATLSVGSNCSSPVTLPEGTYSVVAANVAASYVQTGLSCTTNNDGSFAETGSSAVIGSLTITVCTITYTYVTQQIGVDVVVINDDGGTATAADVIVRLLDSGGNEVASGTDPEEGTGNAMLIFTVPLGDYTVVAAGPADYTIDIATTIIERPGDLATSTFSVTNSQTANLVVTINDPAPTTTTTEPPASTDPPANTDPPASTAAPTTAAPTTAAPAVLPASGDLPATGATDETVPIALIALLLLGLGGGAVLAARRT